MFAPKIAKVQTKAPESPTRKLTPQPSTLAARLFGGAIEQVRVLQGTIGNQATLRYLTQRLSDLPVKGTAEQHEQEAASENMTTREAPRLPGIIQPKLVVSEVNDPLEHEADRVAEQVTRAPGPTVSTPKTLRSASWDFSKIPLFAPNRPRRSEPPPPLLQRQLAIGQVNDPLEHEADRVAEEVMRMPASDVSAAAAPAKISRKCAEYEEEVENPQRKEAGLQAVISGVPSSVHEVLRMPGEPLDPGVRSAAERRFGHDFGKVRLHTGPNASEAAAAVGAPAFTLGRHIVAQDVSSDPETPEGHAILSHELTHVVQQASFDDHALGGAPVLDAAHPSEREACAGTGAPTPLASPAIQRAPVDIVTSGNQQVVDLSNPSWRQTLKFPKGQTQVVYVLRDATTHEYLKVGKTTVSEIYDRFGEYVTAGNKWSRKLAVDVWTFRARSTKKVEAFEAEIRAGIESAGARLPWDNSRVPGKGPRQGRPGQGIPMPKEQTETQFIDEVEQLRVKHAPPNIPARRGTNPTQKAKASVNPLNVAPAGETQKPEELPPGSIFAQRPENVLFQPQKSMLEVEPPPIANPGAKPRNLPTRGEIRAPGKLPEGSVFARERSFLEPEPSILVEDPALRGQATKGTETTHVQSTTSGIIASQPPTRFSTGTRAAAGVLGVLTIASEIIGSIAPIINQQRRYNARMEATVRFFDEFGGKPQSVMEDVDTGIQQPKGTKSDTGAVYGRWVAPRLESVDVPALLAALPGKLTTMQGLVEFLGTGRMLQVIEQQGKRYFLSARGYVEITATVERIRSNLMRKLDEQARAQMASKGGEGVYRIRSRDVTVYRYAEGVRQPWRLRSIEVPIITAREFSGDNMWVRAVGQKGNRVQVEPANAEAEGLAQNAWYIVPKAIKDAYKEVEGSGRTIVSRQPADGSLEGFIAAPFPPQLGYTRYMKHPNPDWREFTIAIGELRQFWIDRDDLEPVSAEQIDVFVRGAPTAPPPSRFFTSEDRRNLPGG